MPETATADPNANGIDRALMSVAIVVVLGAIMSILDTTVVNVAISTSRRRSTRRSRRSSGSSRATRSRSRR